MIYKHYYVKDGVAIKDPIFNQKLELEEYSNFRFTEGGVTYHYKFHLVEDGVTRYFYLEDQKLTDYWEEVMAKQHSTFKRK